MALAQPFIVRPCLRGHGRLRVGRPFVATLAVACAISLGQGAQADAAYYVAREIAESYARQWMHQVWPGESTGAACRVKRGRDNERVRGRTGRWLYHKWTCGFYVGEPGAACKGHVSIYGSDGQYDFYYFRHESRGEIC